MKRPAPGCAPSEPPRRARDLMGLRVRIRHGDLTPRELVARSIVRARAVGAGENGLNAILWSDARRALAEADERARDVGQERPGMLCGIPILVADNIATVDLPTTCASPMLEGYVSPYEATAVTRLRRAGAIVVGKTNVDEFGLGESTSTSAYGPTRNPHDRTRTAGGASGGAAAAVAAGIARIAVGADTGGCLRQPAAYCGVVAVKPTAGRVSRHGLVGVAASLDHLGIIAASVNDAAVALEVIAGRCPSDSTTDTRPVPPLRASRAREQPTLEQGAATVDGSPSSSDPRQRVRDAKAAAAAADRPLVVGLPREFFAADLDPDIRACCDRAVDALRGAGITCRELSLPSTALALPAHHVIASLESAADLARYDGNRFGLRVGPVGGVPSDAATRSRGFGDEIIRRLVLAGLLAADARATSPGARALAARRAIVRELEAALGGVDLLFTPTTPDVAPRLGARDDDALFHSHSFTVAANLAGLPALTLPIGRVRGLPVGGQLMAARFAEPQLFTIGRRLEHALGAEAHR